MGLKWRVKSWFSCLKLPTKLRSWKSRDKMSSTEMVGTEQLLSWDLSRLSSVSSFPVCIFTGPSLFCCGRCWSPGLSPALGDECVWATRGCYSPWIFSGHCLLAQQLCPFWMGARLPLPPELQLGFTTLSQNPKLLGHGLVFLQLER